jgi:hypothetical protein
MNGCCHLYRHTVDSDQAQKDGSASQTVSIIKDTSLSAVNSEIRRAVKLGILDSMPAGFFDLELSSSEERAAKEMTGKMTFGAADIECLVVAGDRDCLLLSNDRQVGDEAASLGLDHLSLPLLLRELWRTGVVPKADVAKLIDEIESKDRIAINNRSLILR